VSNNSANQQVFTPTPDEAAIKLSRNAIEYTQIGIDAYTKGDYETALDNYNKAVAANPKYTRAWNEKGRVLTVLNRTSEAISAYDASLAVDKSQYGVWNNRGEALVTLGRYTEALESFEKALQIAPSYAKANENRNLTLSKLK
jgi:tetratricopeptide (TPR) repeat protein